MTQYIMNGKNEQYIAMESPQFHLLLTYRLPW